VDKHLKYIGELVDRGGPESGGHPKLDQLFPDELDSRELLSHDAFDDQLNRVERTKAMERVAEEFRTNAQLHNEGLGW
jgi:hypothetical protein